MLNSAFRGILCFALSFLMLILLFSIFVDGTFQIERVVSSYLLGIALLAPAIFVLSGAAGLFANRVVNDLSILAINLIAIMIIVPNNRIEAFLVAAFVCIAVLFATRAWRKSNGP